MKMPKPFNLPSVHFLLDWTTSIEGLDEASVAPSEAAVVAVTTALAGAGDAADRERKKAATASPLQLPQRRWPRRRRRWWAAAADAVACRHSRQGRGGGGWDGTLAFAWLPSPRHQLSDIVPCGPARRLSDPQAGTAGSPAAAAAAAFYPTHLHRQHAVRCCGHYSRLWSRSCWRKGGQEEVRPGGQEEVGPGGRGELGRPSRTRGK